MKFSTIKEAKDYLAEKIAAEAEREGIPLSEIERKMLYFSEMDWTLPDMASVSAEFDREYDQDDYEQKITGLARRIEERNRTENPEEKTAWHDAIKKLSEGDNYLTVLIRMVRPPASKHGFVPTTERPAKRPPHDIFKLWVTALAVVFGTFAFLGLGNWFFGSGFGDWFLDRNHFDLLLLLGMVVWFLVGYWKYAPKKRLSRKSPGPRAVK